MSTSTSDLHASTAEHATGRNGATNGPVTTPTTPARPATPAPAPLGAFAQEGDSAKESVAALKRAGIDLVCSLPDKWLSAVLKAVDDDGSFTHLTVTREEEALGICAGAYLGGRKGVTICQTAGMLL